MSRQAFVFLLSIPVSKCPISLTISIDTVSVWSLARIIHEGSSRKRAGAKRDGHSEM
jgi:hypothetical protein